MVPHGGSTVVTCGVYSVCRMNRVEIYFGEWLRDLQEIYQTRLTFFVAGRDIYFSCIFKESSCHTVYTFGSFVVFSDEIAFLAV